jgi:ABC-type antimicrobial peptide transport system permease subunit
VLPAVVLSIGYAALIMRYMRASLLEVLNQDYVRTARRSSSRSCPRRCRSPPRPAAARRSRG